MAEAKLGQLGDNTTPKNDDIYLEGVVKQITDRSYTKKDGDKVTVKRILCHYYNKSNVLAATCFDVTGEGYFQKMNLCEGVMYGFTLRLLMEVNRQTGAVYPKIACIGADRLSTLMV